MHCIYWGWVHLRFLVGLLCTIAELGLKNNHSLIDVFYGRVYVSVYRSCGCYFVGKWVLFFLKEMWILFCRSAIFLTFCLYMYIVISV
jgi:hypothetical protein